MKKILGGRLAVAPVFFALTLALFLLPSRTRATLAEEPTANWNFNDCTAGDASGNGHDGELKGLENSSCMPGFHANAFEFGMGKWVRIPHGSFINFGPGDSFTIAAAAKPHTLTVRACNETGRACDTAGAIAVKCPANSEWNYGLYYMRDSRRFMFGYHWGVLINSPVVSEDEWHYAVGTYAGGSRPSGLFFEINRFIY